MIKFVRKNKKERKERIKSNNKQKYMKDKNRQSGGKKKKKINTNWVFSSAKRIIVISF